MATARRRRGYGGYIVLNGQRLELEEHATDFTVMAAPEELDAATLGELTRVATRRTRARAASSNARDRAMDEVRKGNVAHHVYRVQATGEEICIDDKIILNLRREGTGELERIMREHHLEYVRRMGDAHVLRVTTATGRNPLKLANELAQLDEVAACSPQVMMDLQFHQHPVLFPEQWYLSTDLQAHPDVLPGADIEAARAWGFGLGREEIVVAVVDDGFDLEHEAFNGVALHPDRRDFMGVDASPEPGPDSYHGTPVASIAVGSHQGAAMRGIAPGCTFLPVRIGFGRQASHIDILDVFQFVSQRADVVNCSFGLPPSSFDLMHPDFRKELSSLTETGGRRGKGLVMVFSAANDDAPTFLAAAENVNGVRFTRRNVLGGMEIAEIPAGSAVFSGYPMTPGVITVASMSSLLRKAGYSCWGPHVSVAAPSNNLHYIQAFIARGQDSRRDLFVADYRGLGQVAAVNRPGRGRPFDPIRQVDDPTTPDLAEHIYTRSFGGTSGAAPVVAGVAALVLSANPALSAGEVRQILMNTADRNLDPTLDLANDPNVQGLSGAFVDGRSPFFGAGKVNAARAVERARALAGLGDQPPRDDDGPGVTQIFYGRVHANMAVPDNAPAGIVSEIEVPASGRLADIGVTVDITHTYRGDLSVVLTSPQGRSAELHAVTRGESEDDLRRTYRAADTPMLGELVRDSAQVGGRWSLRVSDNLSQDRGVLNLWELELRARAG
jgi:subtilisin-like proprotein convertase family protein